MENNYCSTDVQIRIEKLQKILEGGGESIFFFIEIE